MKKFFEGFKEFSSYIMSWFCWIIELFYRIPLIILEYFGVRPRRILKVSVKILSENKSEKQEMNILNMMEEVKKSFNYLDIELVILGFNQRIKHENILNSITCRFRGIFSKFFIWFSKNAYQQKNVITIFFVPDIIKARGCSYPGTNWILVDNNGKASTVIHEIGHLSGLWFHSKDPENIMATPSSSDKITKFQFCMIRTSRFSKIKTGSIL